MKRSRDWEREERDCQICDMDNLYQNQLKLNSREDNSEENEGYPRRRRNRRRRHKGRRDDIGEEFREIEINFEDKEQMGYEEITKERCYPVDTYGFNTHIISYTPVNMVKDDIGDLRIHFVASIKIPVGFIANEDGYFTKHLNVDQHALSIETMTQEYAYVINGTHCSENYVKMQVYVVNGAIYYNLSLSNFVSAVPVQDSNLKVYTNFSTADLIPVDKILAYGSLDEPISPSYKVEIVEGPETIIIPNGRCAKRDSKAYRAWLCNADITRILNFNYTIIIKSTCNEK